MRCFKIVSDEMEWLRLKFGHMLRIFSFTWHNDALTNH